MLTFTFQHHIYCSRGISVGPNFVIDSQKEWENYLQKEWLETNGQGGQSLSSVPLCHTRKYHGLFSVTLPDIGGKYLLLSHIDTVLLTAQKQYSLTTHKYPYTYHPDGYRFLKSFQLELFPSWHYSIPEQKVDLKVSLQLLTDENSLLIRYDLIKAKDTVTLQLSPRLAYRHIHTLTKANHDINVRSYKEMESFPHFSLFKVDPYPMSLPPLLFGGQGVSFYPAPQWHYQVEYPEEQRRGFDFHEDHYIPGLLEKELRAGESFYLYVSLNPPQNWPEELWTQEVTKRQTLYRSFPPQDSLREIKFHSRHFFTKGLKGEEQITAGFPWFAEWGRDTMIALPGLTLYTGQNERAFQILSNFAQFEKKGLLPNYLPQKKGDTPAYNSIDSSLWFFWSVQEYLKISGDAKRVQSHFIPIMQKIIEAYTENQVPHAVLTSNGLISAGDETTQLTWMDAKVHGQPVTPRFGYAVEINALWYNALCFYLDIHSHLDQVSFNNLNYIREQCRLSFIKEFWSEEKGYLADVSNSVMQDFSIRPNQIIAVSLPYSPLDDSQMKKVVSCVEKYLLTPYGLRTLSPKDPHYCPFYEGGIESRDGAYHQGTVWPWLLGHYVSAALRATENRLEKAQQLLHLLTPLVTTHLKEHGLFSIAEIFDGDPPHNPNGCIAQAWSVAETIRAHMTLNHIVKRK